MEEGQKEGQEEELLLLLHTCRKMCVCVFTSGFMFSGRTPRTLPDADPLAQCRVVPNTTAVCFPGINQKLG